MNLSSKVSGLRQIWHFDNRWHLLVSRLLFRREEILIYRKGSLRLLVDHSAGDPSGAPEVFATPMYADHLGTMPKGRALNVLDIGANVGGFPLFLATHGVSLRKVVSVELNPRTCIRLQFNLERNLKCTTRVINAGLCGRPRPLQLPLGEGSVADSLYAASFNASGVLVDVAGRTFDDLFADAFGDDTVDVCKLDVEAAEYEVIASEGHTRLRDCRLLIIEIHEVEGDTREGLASRIEALGFERLPMGTDRSVYVFRNRTLLPTP